jgi:hypothetical protein
MTNEQGTVMATKTFQGNNFASLGDWTGQCEGSVGGWNDGFFNVELSAPYTRNDGAVTVRITNTLDQGAGDESIGYGDMEFIYEYDPSSNWVYKCDIPTRSPADYDVGVENPDGLWENDCSASRKECGGM